MKPADAKSKTYIDFHVENNDKDSKFKMIRKGYQKINEYGWIKVATFTTDQ